MILNRTKLYLLLFIACLVGYLWLFYGSKRTAAPEQTFSVCPIKRAIHIPCPSCGSTRSVEAFTQGRFLEALYVNPLGILIAMIMAAVPLWILYDISTRRNTLLSCYIRMEAAFKKPQVFIPAIILILLNWIWNIIKEL